MQGVRTGKFGVMLTINNKWLEFANLENLSEKNFVESAREQAKLRGEKIIVYICSKEYEIGT